MSALKNEHLVWDLQGLADHSKAMEFAKQFQNSLCVYSGPVRQLYSNYELHVPPNDSRKLVVLPDPYSHHDTYQGVNEEACVSTGFNIIPGELGNKKGLFLTIPLNNGKSRAVPIGVAMHMIRQKTKPNAPFLPVVTKGDLREFKQSLPSLHLHRLDLRKIEGRSEMEIRSIRKVIEEKLNKYFKREY